MKIGYISFEVSPFAKVGGLADVAGALPKYLKNIGEDIYVVMPYHKVIEKNYDTSKFKLEKEGMYPQSHLISDSFSVYSHVLPDSDVKIYFIKNDKLFWNEDVYEFDRLDIQSSYFCDAAFSLIKEFEKDTKVINVNDWQTSLMPVYLKNNYSDDEILGGLSTVLTIHNLGYQGVFTSDIIDDIGLPSYLYNVDALEFYGKVNMLKGGILFSDVINTVSKTYAEEIQSEDYGYGLDGVLRIRGDHLYGIVNGIDYEEYNPLKNHNIFTEIHDYSDKIKNKIHLQHKLNLPEKPDVPILSIISRLVDQKGFDILKNIIDYTLLFDVQFVLLGTGKKEYEEYFKNLQNRYPDKVSINIDFDQELAMSIYAGSDMFLMPSKYEPCGLGQMYAMRYGTIPVVRYTGGLSDTVREYYHNTKTGTGFGFYEYDCCKLFMAISKSIYTYYNSKEDWFKLFENVMNQNFSYESTAKQYKDLYKIATSYKKRW